MTSRRWPSVPFSRCSSLCPPSPRTTPPYLDPAQPIEARVADLVGRLEVKEKIDLLSSTAPAVERLGIPEYDYWNESLHGVARAGRATIFPQAIGMAATFDPDLLERVATVISDEARAKHNASVRAGFRQRYRGLTFWTPNINIFRDPRWGRGQETYGEDPFLMAQMGTAYVRGLQGDDPRYLKAAACAKHYAVHSGPEGNRHSFDAIASPKELNETYLPAFEALVGAGVEIVMCAYNRTNGEPCCSSEFLLQKTLRDDWGFDGHVVSDCGAVDDLHGGHKVTKDAAESAAATLKAGTDLACTSYAALHQAFERKLVTEADIDRALGRVLRTRFRLGFFDPADRVPWSDIPETVIASDAHRQLSREAAVKSMVVLKNNDGLLPLAKDLRMVYVTGPLAADAQVMLGNYYGLNEDIATVLEGVVGKVSAATKVDFRQGALLDRTNVNPIDWFSGSAREADVTIAVMGVSNLLEGEEGASIASPDKGDRFDVSLPANQVAFVKKMRENARKLVVVVLSGSPVAMPEVHEMADAVVMAWYPGMEGGRADRRRPLRRRGALGPPAPHLPEVHGPAPALRGLPDGRADLPLHEGGAALPLRVRSQHHDVRLRGPRAVGELDRRGRDAHREGPGLEHRRLRWGRGGAALRLGPRREDAGAAGRAEGVRPGVRGPGGVGDRGVHRDPRDAVHRRRRREGGGGEGTVPAHRGRRLARGHGRWRSGRRSRRRGW